MSQGKSAWIRCEEPTINTSTLQNTSEDEVLCHFVLCVSLDTEEATVVQ